MFGESASPNGLLANATPVDAPNGLAEMASSSVGGSPSGRDAPNGLIDEASSLLGETPSGRISSMAVEGEVGFTVSASAPARPPCADGGIAQGSAPEPAAARGTEDGEPSTMCG